MSNRDRIEGKAREIAGKLTSDDELEQQGRTQHAKGEAEELLAEAKARTAGAWEAVKDTVGIDGPDDPDADHDDPGRHG